MHCDCILTWRVGSDARTTDFSYEYEAQVVRGLGFTTIKQVDACIGGYDDDQLSRIRWQWRQGPITRFEDMLLAGMGPVFVERLTNDADWRDRLSSSLARYQELGIPIRNYDPKVELRGESPE